MAEVTVNNVWFLAVALIFLPLTATSVTWTSPSPAWTPKDQNDIRTFVMPVLNGSNQVALRWRYTLSAGSVLITTFSLRLNDGSFDDIGTTSSGVFNTKDYRARFNISRSELATLIINKVTEREDTVYQCKVTTDSGPSSYRIQVIVTVPVKLIHVSGDQTVLEGSNTTLFCEGTGKPTPNITLTRVLKDGSDGETLPQRLTYNFPNINRSASGTYRCKAENEYETVSQVFELIVIYPAKIVKLVSEHELAAQQSVALDCQAEGNPLPTYSWTPCGTTCDPQQIECNERLLIFQDRDKSVYTLTCKVTNNLGSDTRNTSLFIASNTINVTLVLTGEECTDGEYNQLWGKLGKMIDEIFAGKLGYESVQQKNIRCGSVIVDLALKFSSTVRESEVLSILRDAADNGKFGDFNVTAITGTRDTGITTTTAITPTSSSDIKSLDNGHLGNR